MNGRDEDAARRLFAVWVGPHDPMAANVPWSSTASEGKGAARIPADGVLPHRYRESLLSWGRVWSCLHESKEDESGTHQHIEVSASPAEQPEG